MDKRTITVKSTEQMNNYPFAEWSEDRINERLADVIETDQIPHSKARADSIAREMTHLMFELEWRQNNG